MLRAENIDVKHYRSLEHISVEDWNIDGAPYNPFHELDFLSVLQKSEVEKARYEYLIFSKKNKTIATAVLSCFTIDLSLFIGSEKWVLIFKKLFPRFFNLKIMFCGTPVSIGHSNFYCSESREACLSLLNKHMIDLARAKKVKYLVLKEIDIEKVKVYQPVLEDNGWFVGHSLPDTKMSIKWNTYEEYLGSLKSRYRRQILLGLSSLNGGKRPAPQSIPALLKQNIQVLSSQDIDFDKFYNKYLSVMNRAEIKLETLNLEYFKELAASYRNGLKYFVGQTDDGDSCYALCYENGAHLHFLWTAKDVDKDARNCYLNQLQAMISYAIERRIKFFHVGQTAYYPKMRIGAMPEDRYLFFKSLNPLMNPILRKLKNILFPPLILDSIQPFKSSIHNA